MSKRKYSEAEMIGALRQLEAGCTAADVGRELGVSKHTIYAWKAKYGGMSVSEALRCDNGPEFTSRHFVAWCAERGIEVIPIEPGKPVQGRTGNLVWGLLSRSLRSSRIRVNSRIRPGREQRQG